MNHTGKVIRKLVLLVVVAMIGCSGKHKSLKPSAYIQYMDDADHGMIKTIEIGKARYEFQLTPPEYMAAKEQNGHYESEVEVEKRIEELRGYMFCSIKISPLKDYHTIQEQFVDDQQGFAKAMYYDEAAAEDLTAQTNNKELRPSAYHYEDNYGIAPYNKIIAGFLIDQYKSGGFELRFNDRFNGYNHIKVQFSESDITGLPVLQIK